jgi:hypothetical protein
MLTVVLTVAYFAVERSLGLVAARLLVFKSIELSSNLAAYGLTTLVLGPFFPWTSWGDLPSTLGGVDLRPALFWGYTVTLTVLAALGWACHRAHPRRLRQILGFALLAGCAYGTIAVARAPVLEMQKLEMFWMATTARYHYLPQLGLAMALGLALSEAWRRPGSQRRPSRPRWLVPVVFAGGLAMLAPFYAAAARRVATEIDPGWREALDSVVKEVQRRAHAAPPGEPVYIPNRRFQDWRGWASREDFPGWAAVFVMAHASDSIEGRRVFFVEPDEELVRSLRKDPGARISRLVVTPHEVNRALDGPDSAR